MSAPINDGGPAFPSAPITGATDARAEQRDGMSLRDWFAGQAEVPWNAVIQTLHQNAVENLQNRGIKGDARTEFSIDEVVSFRAAIKYLEADAMMAERAKQEATP